MKKELADYLNAETAKERLQWKSASLKELCEKHDIRCSIRNRGGKVYATLSWPKVCKFNYGRQFVEAIFPNSRLTSGCGFYGTYRLNP